MVMRVASKLSKAALSSRSRNSAAIRLSSLFDVATINNSTKGRYFSSHNDNLPYHLVVGMPALSPTMESGTIACWNVKEGDTLSAGDSIADIETDKATMAFEAQDDAYVAKIFVEAGTGNSINVGEPIMLTVEEEEDIPAFKTYLLPENQQSTDEESPLAVEKEVTPTPSPPNPVKEASSPPPLPPPPQAPTPTQNPDTNPFILPPSSADAAAAVITMSPVWGEHVKVSSPIKSHLSEQQKRYVELYGSTGQTPI